MIARFMTLVAAAAAGVLAQAGPAPSAIVDMPRSYLFRPDTLTVRQGTRVVWTNHDVFTHGVRLEDGGAVNLVARPGHQVAHVFTRPGVFAYVCPFHSQMMKGVVRVVAAGR